MQIEKIASRQHDITVVRCIRYGLLTLGGAGLLVACCITYLLPISALIWNHYLRFAFFAFLPLVWLKLGYFLRITDPNSRMKTIMGIWMTYRLGILGEVIFVACTGFAIAITGSGSGLDLDNREKMSYLIFTFFNVIDQILE